MRPRNVGLFMLALVATLASCGRTVAPSDVLSQVANTWPAASSRFSVASSYATETTTGGRFVTIYTGGGIFDFARKEASVDLAVESPRRSSFRLILDSYGVYLHSAQVRRDLPAGKQWVKLGRKQVRELGLDVYWFVRGDPTQEFEFLLRRTERVQDFGRDVLHRTEADHYRMTVSMRRIESALREGGKGLAEWSRYFYAELVKRLGTDNRLIVDAWIDDTGRVVRGATTFTAIFSQDNPTEITYRIVIDYFNYSRHRVLPLVTPPARQRTVDASELGKR